MKALEVIGQVDAQGRLVLEHLPISSSEVKVILLYANEIYESVDPDNDPTEEVEESLRRALKQVQAGQRIPLSEIWDELEEDSAAL
jgi:hypothetical protein